MKKLVILSALAVLVALGAGAKKKTDIILPDSTGFKFTDIKVAKTTPVTDQNKTGTCWCFSTNTFFENEILKKTGKEVNLSEMFVVNHCYLDKAMKYVRMDGAINFAEGGSALDVPYVWKKYGMMPEEAYAGLNYGEDKHNHKELIQVLKNYMDGVKSIPNKKLSTAWYKGLQGILNAYLGELPETFTYQGKSYTPESFAKSVGVDINDYLAFTSFTHHPFYTEAPIEVADNWLWGTYKNVKLDELKAIVDNAIENGYTIEWAADVSEGGFQWKNGFAILPQDKPESDLEGTELARWTKLSDSDREKEKYDFDGPVAEINVTQELRQTMFDNHETTDDHGMVIVGSAVDQKGNKYYKVQNSWDTNQLYDGFIYVSEPYFLAKTLNILVNKNAVPKSILSKFKL